MPMDKNEQISKRAYDIWEEEGRPEGRHNDHWNRAQSEISKNVRDSDGETKGKTVYGKNSLSGEKDFSTSSGQKKLVSGVSNAKNLKIIKK